MSFRAIVVVGNEKGQVGVGVGKAGDVIGAVRKGVADGKKHLVPRGISIWAPLFQEDKLISFGKQIESLFKFFKNKPPNFS